jgi:hypothetical protein
MRVGLDTRIDAIGVDVVLVAEYKLSLKPLHEARQNRHRLALTRTVGVCARGPLL